MLLATYGTAHLQGNEYTRATHAHFVSKLHLSYKQITQLSCSRKVTRMRVSEYSENYKLVT